MDLPLSLSVGVQGLHGLVGHVAVQLGRGLKGRVHGEHGHPGVDGVNVPVGHVAGTVPPPPWSVLPSSASCQITWFSSKIRRTFPTTSAEASEAPDLPRAPVYLLRQTP